MMKWIFVIALGPAPVSWSQENPQANTYEKIKKTLQLELPVVPPAGLSSAGDGVQIKLVRFSPLQPSPVESLGRM